MRAKGHTASEMAKMRLSVSQLFTVIDLAK